MENAWRHLRDLPLVIEQEGSLTLAQIGVRSRRIKGGMEAQGKRTEARDRRLPSDHQGAEGHVEPGAGSR